MSDHVRVRLENGAEVTMRRQAAKNAGLAPLKKPACGLDGRPLPTKLRTPLGSRPDQPTTSTTATPAANAPEEG